MRRAAIHQVRQACRLSSGLAAVAESLHLHLADEAAGKGNGWLADAAVLARAMADEALRIERMIRKARRMQTLNYTPPSAARTELESSPRSQATESPRG